MSLKNALMEQTVTGVTSTTIAARAGESLLIKDVQVLQASALKSYITLNVDQDSVRYLAIGAANRNHCGGLAPGDYMPNLMGRLRLSGVNVDIPVASGQIFTVEGLAATDYCKIVYQIYDATDIKQDMPNGTAGKQRIIPMYGTNSAALAATPVGYQRIDKLNNPSKFGPFPYSQGVPGNTKMELLAIAARCFTKGSAGPVNTYTKHLRLTHNTETLFDRDLQGFLLRGDATATADTYTGTVNQVRWGENTAPEKMLVLDQPVVFTTGDNLVTEMDFGVTGAGVIIAAGDLDVCLIFRQTIS